MVKNYYSSDDLSKYSKIEIYHKTSPRVAAASRADRCTRLKDSKRLKKIKIKLCNVFREPPQPTNGQWNIQIEGHEDFKLKIGLLFDNLLYVSPKDRIQRQRLSF